MSARFEGYAEEALAFLRAEPHRLFTVNEVAALLGITISEAAVALSMLSPHAGGDLRNRADCTPGKGGVPSYVLNERNRENIRALDVPANKDTDE